MTSLGEALGREVRKVGGFIKTQRTLKLRKVRRKKMEEGSPLFTSLGIRN